MSLESEINSLRSKIGSMKRELSSVDSELSKAHSDKMRATSSSSMGIAMMGNSSTRAYGTYSYLRGSNDSIALSSKISRLESQKSSLKSKIEMSERKLKDLEIQFEYESRPEAKLISTEKGIFVDGDEKKTNLISWAEAAVADYVADYERIIHSAEVTEYKELDAEITSFAKSAQLPQATDENVRALEVVKRRNGVPFEYVVIDGKIIVNRDFSSQEIALEQRKISDYENLISENQKKREGFEPTTLGKIFRGVRKKQQAQFDSVIDAEDEKHQEEISSIQSKIKELETARDIYIAPSTPIMPKLDRLIKLCESKDVRAYVYELEDIEKNIAEHTILTGAMNYDVVSKIISEAKACLDSKRLKLTRKHVLETILKGAYKGEAAVEILKAIGEDSSEPQKTESEMQSQQSKQTEKEPSQPSVAKVRVL